MLVTLRPADFLTGSRAWPGRDVTCSPGRAASHRALRMTAQTAMDASRDSAPITRRTLVNTSAVRPRIGRQVLRVPKAAIAMIAIRTPKPRTLEDALIESRRRH